MSLNPKITQWCGKRVWLLGASSGIGAALALELAQRGAHVALSSRHVEAVEQVRATLPGSGHLALACDVLSAAQLEAACAQIFGYWAGVDVAIYLAGDYAPLRASDFTPEAVRKLCEVNYLGAVNFSHAVLPMLPRDNSGGLVLVSSVAGYRGLPKALGYGPSKAALIHFAEILFLDLRPRGIGVWVVNPGFVATRLTAQNDFHMPALIPPSLAAKAFLDELAQGRFDIHFPKRFTLFMKLLRLLPYSLYFRLVRRTAGD
jgi:NAD(P)-dependent dehydrogenase (short-subunit alcohol dehydrogenase family)